LQRPARHGKAAISTHASCRLCHTAAQNRGMFIARSGAIDD